ncbi:MAG TPA: AmmeMemoRadiSam system protein A [Anaerolineales bacterium]|nr:AmmeMemoRadiSam system protein A [Anaerolineales bacterium]
MENRLTPEEQRLLIRLAREAIECGVKGWGLPPLDPDSLPPRLWEPGASFVTLTVRGQLRGCIGALEPYQPLAEDVRDHAVAAALQDPRFPPVKVEELDGIRIEVSRLTHATPLEYADAEDLLSKLHPDVDGVILRDDTGRRGTFLPQVWEKIRSPAEFLDNLCYKMGIGPDSWRSRHFEVLVYQVEEFHE